MSIDSSQFMQMTLVRGSQIDGKTMCKPVHQTVHGKKCDCLFDSCASVQLLSPVSILSPTLGLRIRVCLGAIMLPVHEAYKPRHHGHVYKLDTGAFNSRTVQLHYAGTVR